jgi:hypothetical protein
MTSKKLTSIWKGLLLVEKFAPQRRFLTMWTWVHWLFLFGTLWAIAGMILTWRLYRSVDGDPIMFGSPWSFVFFIIITPAVNLWVLAYHPFAKRRDYASIEPASPGRRRR